MPSTIPDVLNVKKGAKVWSGGRSYTVISLLDLKTILAKSHDDGQSYKLAISELKATRDESKTQNVISLVDIPEKDWEVAEKRFEVIKPLLATPKYSRTANQVRSRAEACGVGLSTLYRWLDYYESTGLMSSLVRTKRSDVGRSKISAKVEEIINDVIRDEYLNEQRVKVATVHEEIEARCRKQKLKPPHINTVRSRINSLPEALKIRKRRGRQVAKGYEPIRGHFPGAEWPLAYVQIDHTPLDIILVDDQHREPIGKPYITLALDVFSRMVTGFYLSLDPPSCHTVGICISHSVLPKTGFLNQFDIQSDWPITGKMKTIHADNALEFRSDVLQRACDQHQINLEWRPVREPQYGGHVERVFRTINSRVHELPGTTFSNVKEREYYKSEKYSAFTLSEFEAWLTTFIVDKYHQSFHSEINMSPLRRFEQGILGDPSANILGVGMPPRVVDEERFRIDFMPYVKRTIQNYGMRNQKINYYHDVLRPWINSKSISNSKERRRFIFHYDPRDISKYYFWDPEISQYFTIPYRDNSRPPISLWELREANRKAREEGLSHIDEDVIFDAHERLKAMTLDAVNKTQTERKRLRREAQRKIDHQRQMSRIAPTIAEHKSIEADPFDCIDFDSVEELPIDDSHI